MLGRATTEHVRPVDFRRVFAELPAPVALVSVGDGEMRIAAVSAGFVEQMRVSALGAEGQRVAELFRAGGASIERAIVNCLETRGPVQIRVAHGMGDRVVRLRVEARPQGDGVCLTVKVLAARPTLAEVGEAAMLAEIGPLLGGLVFVRDLAKHRLRYGPHPLVAQLGLPFGGINAAGFVAKVHSADRGALRRHMQTVETLDDKTQAEVCLRLRTTEGPWLWFAIRSRVLERADDGSVRRVVGIARDVTRDRETSRALVDASLRLAHAELNERRRVGRELHDSTSQQLVAVGLGLRSLEHRVALEGESRAVLTAARLALATAQREIRNFSYLLHPPGLDEGLPIALKDFGAGFSLRTGLKVSVTVGDGPWELPELMQVSLFRVGQEALMNVYRHGHARQAVMRLTRDEQSVVLEVEDDGVGLPLSPSGVPAALLGVGVRGMQARMTQLSGSLELAAANPGLIVRARAPLPPG